MVHCGIQDWCIVGFVQQVYCEHFDHWGTGPVIITVDPNLVIHVPADVQARGSASPSIGSVLTADYHFNSLRLSEASMHL